MGNLIVMLLMVWGVYLGLLFVRSFTLRNWYGKMLVEELTWLEEHQEFQSKALSLGLLRFDELFKRRWELYFKVWIDLESVEESVFNYYREDVPLTGDQN